MTPVLELADVTFRRDGKQIIDGISLTVLPGEHWALLGPNGAGKSTLLGFCAAVTFPTSGTVHVLGEQMGRTELARLRHSIGHVNPRHRLHSALTVRELVLTGLTATIDVPMRWSPSADGPPARRRDDRDRRDDPQGRRRVAHAVTGRAGARSHCAGVDFGSPAAAARRTHHRPGRRRPRAAAGNRRLARRGPPGDGVDPRDAPPGGTADDHHPSRC